MTEGVGFRVIGKSIVKATAIALIALFSFSVVFFSSSSFLWRLFCPPSSAYCFGRVPAWDPADEESPRTTDCTETRKYLLLAFYLGNEGGGSSYSNRRRGGGTE